MHAKAKGPSELAFRWISSAIFFRSPSDFLPKSFLLGVQLRQRTAESD